MSDDSICHLCGSTSPLQTSHIIPAFVFRWIKETSATGYIRKPNNEKRFQDGHKDKLFCSKCEQFFSGFERQFASNIFYPFVNDELDKKGIPQGRVSPIPYTEWLLKFVISLQWRVLFLMNDKEETLTSEQKQILESAKAIWKDYLLDKRSDTGTWKSHIIFLYNLEGAIGDITRTLPEKLNRYLFRSVDSTTVSTSKKLGLFTKLGPIAVWTCLEPQRSKGLQSCLIKKQGEISFVQSVEDTDVTEFLYFTRPREVMNEFKPSSLIDEQITKTIRKNPLRALKSMTVQVQASDFALQEKAKNKK